METNQKEYLVKVCLQRHQGAKAEAAAIAATRRSEFEALLEKAYSVCPYNDDSHPAQLYKLAKSTAAKANEELVRRAEELGMSLDFKPSLRISYSCWHEYVQYFWDDDRWRAAQRLRRLEREATAQIERTSIDTLVQLMDERLTPAEAKTLVEAIPVAAELIPELRREDLKGEPDHAEDVVGALDSEEPPY